MALRSSRPRNTLALAQSQIVDALAFRQADEIGVSPGTPAAPGRKPGPQPVPAQQGNRGSRTGNSSAHISADAERSCLIITTAIVIPCSRHGYSILDVQLSCYRRRSRSLGRPLDDNRNWHPSVISEALPQIGGACERLVAAGCPPRSPAVDASLSGAAARRQKLDSFSTDFEKEVTLTRKSQQWGGRSIPDGPWVRFPGL